MTPVQQATLDHWIKYMPVAPAYFAAAIKSHFERTPGDRAALEEPARAHWKKLKSEGVI
jgi:hypothetical protein